MNKILTNCYALHEIFTIMVSLNRRMSTKQKDYIPELKLHNG